MGEIEVTKNLLTAQLTEPQAAMRGVDDGLQSRNVVLGALLAQDYEALGPHLEAIDLPQHFILHEQAEEITHIYFPLDGMVSLVVLAKDGRSVEVAVVGREGVVGGPRLGGMMAAPYRGISQIPGSALRVRADIIESLLPSIPGLHTSLGRYTLMQGMQTAQTAACNRLHEIDQRLARWLLMCQDRVERETLLLTHEFLAQMLGAGRPTVSLAVGALERAGLIHNVRGAIRILDRPRLQQSVCECYAVMRGFNAELGLLQIA